MDFVDARTFFADPLAILASTVRRIYPEGISLAMLDSSVGGFSSDIAFSGARAKLVEELSKLTIPKSLEELRLARPTGTSMQMLLRNAVRKDLDVKIVPVTRSDDGGQNAMDSDEMAAIYKREQERMLAYKARLEEAVVALEKWGLARRGTDIVHGGFPLPTARVAVAFWYGLDDECTLPQHAVDGLRSCASNSGLKTILLTYQKLQGVPAGVQQSDARTFLSVEAFKSHLSRGVRVQHLSDYIRALALQRSGGWFVDCDTVWFRKAPFLSAVMPPCLGHYFGSLQAHRKSPQGKTVDQIRKHWNSRYLKTPGDFAYIASPCAFPAHSEVLRRWVAKIEAALYCTVSVNAVHPKKYETVFAWLQQVVQQEGLVAAIRDFTDVSPLPATSGSSSLLATKVHMFDLATLTIALCANNYGMTSKASASQIVAEPGSAWDAVLKAATKLESAPCRRVRIKAPCRTASSPRGVPGEICLLESKHSDEEGSGDEVAARCSKVYVDKCVGGEVAYADKCVGGEVAACNPHARKAHDTKCVGESEFGLPFLTGLIAPLSAPWV